MKRKQRKESELNKLVSASGIYTAIELLQASLKVYELSEIAHKHCYTIHLEIIDMNRNVSILQNQLQGLVEESQLWEEIE